MIADRLDILRLAIRCEAHDLVLALVDLEAGEVGKGRIQEADGMREPYLVQHGEIGATAVTDGRGRPFADAVDGQNRRLLER